MPSVDRESKIPEEEKMGQKQRSVGAGGGEKSKHPQSERGTDDRIMMLMMRSNHDFINESRGSTRASAQTSRRESVQLIHKTSFLETKLRKLKISKIKKNKKR